MVLQDRTKRRFHCSNNVSQHSWWGRAIMFESSLHLACWAMLRQVFLLGKCKFFFLLLIKYFTEQFCKTYRLILIGNVFKSSLNGIDLLGYLCFVVLGSCPTTGMTGTQTSYHNDKCQHHLLLQIVTVLSEEITQGKVNNNILSLITRYVRVS